MNSPARPPVLARPASSAGEESSASLIWRELRRQIVSMARLPGTLINEKSVAAEFHVSRTPVREALLRLADEGFVEIAARSATRVARIPAALLPDAMFARSAVEQALARDAARFAKASSVLLLRSSIECQWEAVEAADTDLFHELDEAFHATLAVVAQHGGVFDMVQRLKTQLDRYRRLTLPEQGRMARVVIEHGAIVDAIADGDEDGAARAMMLHLDGLRMSLTAIRTHNPEYFDGDATAIGDAFAALKL